MTTAQKQTNGQQTFMGMPMNWEWDVRKMTRNLWNPEDDRVFLPKVFGIGWDVNGHALLRRIRVLPGKVEEAVKKEA